MSELRSFKFFALSGMDTRELTDIDSVRIVRDDGMTVEVFARRTDGYVSVDAGRGRLLVLPRAANVIYVEEER